MDVLAWTRLLLLAASEKTRLAVEEEVYAFEIEEEEVHFSLWEIYRSDMNDEPSSHPFQEKKIFKGRSWYSKAFFW